MPPIVRLRDVGDRRRQRRSSSSTRRSRSATNRASATARACAASTATGRPRRADAKIRYTNLPAYLFARGYTFEVKARNADGVWSQPLALPASPSRRRWWLRWWAVLALRRRRSRRAAGSPTACACGSCSGRTAMLEDLVMARTEEIRAQAQELETLDRIVEVINREVVLENVLESILEQGMRLFPQAEKATFLQVRSRDAAHGSRRRRRATTPMQFNGMSLSFEEAMRRYSERAEQLEEGVYLIKSDDFRHLAAAREDRAPAGPEGDAGHGGDARRPDGRLPHLRQLHATRTRSAAPTCSKLARVREHAVSAIAKARILRELQIKNEQAEEANRAKSTLPGEHEPRAAHADERHHRLLRDPRRAARRAHRAEVRRLPALDPAVGPAPARASSTTSSTSRKSRRGRWSSIPETFAVRAAIDSVCQVMKGLSREEERSPSTIDVATDVPRDRDRSRQVQADPLQPAVERGEVLDDATRWSTIRARRVAGD